MRNPGARIGRRSFIKGSTAVLAVAAVAPVALLSGRSARAAGLRFSQAYFSDRAGAFFNVDAGAGGWHSLELVGVTDDDASAKLEQFTVRFRGSPNATFIEGTYDVAPPEGDAFALHMQPAGSDDSGAYYEASFSLIRPISLSCAGPA